MNRLHHLDMLLAWYEEYLTINNYRPRSIQAYSFDLSLFRRFLSDKTDLEDIDDLTPQLLRDYVAALYDKGNSAGTIHHKLAALNGFFKAAYEEKKLYADYRGHINLPRVNKKLPANILTEEETRKIFDYHESVTDDLQVKTPDDALLLRDRAIFEVFYSTGIRRNEATGLKLADVDYENGLMFIHEGKGGKDRVVPIGRIALGSIRRYAIEARPLLTTEGNDFLFINRAGRHISHNTIRAIVIKVVKAAGLTKHVKIHGIRHTCATHMLNHGADIRYVQELLGHASLSSTQVYTHVSIKKLKETHAKCHPREQGEL